MMLSQPVIIHVPHASTVIPDDVRPTFCLAGDELQTELIRMTDWYTDELFAMPGITCLHYPVRRLVVDPERFVDDDQELMSRVGMGAVYTQTSFDTPLRQELSPVERQALLDRYYWPHHRRLDQLVAQALEQFGRCLIIDAHSFSPHPLPHEQHQEPNRPDYCLGTGAYHTRPKLVDAAESCLWAMHRSVFRDRPFAGALVPQRYYQTDRRVQSIMIEVSRGLYLQPASSDRSDGFDATSQEVHQLVSTIIETSQQMNIG